MARHHFSKAVQSYDAARTVQREAAAWVIRHATQHLHPILAPSDLMIDAGCGTGALGRAGFPCVTIGVDNAEAMCRAALPYYEACLCADIMAMPFADATVKGLVSSLCWQWSNPQVTIAEMARILQPHGRAVITTLTAGTLPELAHSYEAMGMESRLLPCVTKEALGAWMQEAGLTIHAMEEVVYSPIHQSSLAFFTHLKQIGAHAATTHPPLSPAAFKALMRYYDTHFQSQGGVRVTYVYTGFVIEKKA